MLIPASYSATKTQEDHENGFSWEAGQIYEVLVCQVCHEVTLRAYFWNDGMESEADVTYRTLYPQNKGIPLGLPSNIQKEYATALRLKPIDSNAFGVSLGRVLELVCADRNAEGRKLEEKLSDLAAKGEIPSKLVDVAHNLRKFRNVGAHAHLGELTSDEVPIVDGLCRAILEYVYTAPHLAQTAHNALAALTKRRKQGGAT